MVSMDFDHMLTQAKLLKRNMEKIRVMGGDCAIGSGKSESTRGMHGKRRFARRHLRKKFETAAKLNVISNFVTYYCSAYVRVVGKSHTQGA